MGGNEEVFQKTKHVRRNDGKIGDKDLEPKGTNYDILQHSRSNVLYPRNYVAC